MRAISTAPIITEATRASWQRFVVANWQELAGPGIANLSAADVTKLRTTHLGGTFNGVFDKVRARSTAWIAPCC